MQTIKAPGQPDVFPNAFLARRTWQAMMAAAKTANRGAKRASAGVEV